MPLQAIVFDCDGVILDSVPVKTRAFARLAEPFGEEARDRFVMYHTVHGGVSRYRKFEWFFREVLGREITPEESKEWGERFAAYALDEVRRCALIPGIAGVLDDWRERLPLYVCSGAPQEEVRLVLEERGLSGNFRGIFGSPPAKAVLLAEIVRDAKLDPADVQTREREPLRAAAGLAQFLIEALCVSNHAACRFAEKGRFFRSLRA